MRGPSAGPIPGSLTSEFGRQVAVDLEADADLDESRGGPGHNFLRGGFGFVDTGYWSRSAGATGDCAQYAVNSQRIDNKGYFSERRFSRRDCAMPSRLWMS